MKVTSEFSKEQLVLNIQVQCNLLRKYYKNIVGLLKEGSTTESAGRLIFALFNLPI